MEMTLCVAERYCKCGSELMIEYAGATAHPDSAIVQMWDELHQGADCGPVSPQMAAVARSKMTRRELQHRRIDNRENRVTNVQDERIPRESYDMLFPDKTGIRAATIAGALTALQVPRGTRVRARDAWVETVDGEAQLRVLCKVGGWNRAPYSEGIQVLRGLPEFLADFDETFNKSYASFLFRLPETISVEVRAEMAAQAEPPRDLAVLAHAAKTEFAVMGRVG